MREGSSHAFVVPAHATACTPPDADATPKIQDIGDASLAGITGNYAIPAVAHPTKLVVYKGFGHGITKPRAMRAVMQHNLAWFNHYLWGDPKPDFAAPEVPKKKAMDKAIVDRR